MGLTPRNRLLYALATLALLALTALATHAPANGTGDQDAVVLSTAEPLPGEVAEKAFESLLGELGICKPNASSGEVSIKREHYIRRIAWREEAFYRITSGDS